MHWHYRTFSRERKHAWRPKRLSAEKETPSWPPCLLTSRLFVFLKARNLFAFRLFDSELPWAIDSFLKLDWCIIFFGSACVSSDWVVKWVIKWVVEWVDWWSSWSILSEGRVSSFWQIHLFNPYQPLLEYTSIWHFPFAYWVYLSSSPSPSLHTMSDWGASHRHLKAQPLNS